MYNRQSKEWHPTKNGDLRPSQVTYGSDKKVYWRCSFDPSHTWDAVINSRTTATQMNGCRICGARQKSAPELRILAELNHIFDNILYRERIDGKELDLYIPTLKIGIEYDGAYYHANKLKQDNEKNNFFSERDIFLIRYRRAPLQKISSSDIHVYHDDICKSCLLYTSPSPRD